MKTLEEALHDASSLLDDAEENGLILRNAQDAAKDVMESPLAIDYVMTMVEIAIGRWQAAACSEDPIDCIRSVAFTAFIAGVRVGREMGSTPEVLEKSP